MVKCINMNLKIIAIFVLLTNLADSQPLYKFNNTKKVFTNLVNSYSSNKGAPVIEIVTKNQPGIIAQYISVPYPKIQISEKTYDICMSFDKDSSNALALILSHELAHYYKDHTWCSDYSFALKKSNLKLAKQLNNSSLASKIEKEAIADNDGLFYSSVGGYRTFNIFNKLIDKIYLQYKLPETSIGYPSKQERKLIAKKAQESTQTLYNYFKLGIASLEENNYDEAIANFEKANSYIPFRENYNNLGIAKTLKALQKIPLKQEEMEHPQRFKYPLEKDSISRLYQEITRGMDNENQEELLISAKSDFQKAIQIDPSYINAYINMACVYDLLENYNAAIGVIKGLPKEIQGNNNTKKILAIALFHNGQIAEAKNIWNLLKL